MVTAFLYGIILALGLILPLGIQNVFIFNQGATQKHFLHAMPSVLTAFVCDTVLILLAVLGVSMMVLTIPFLKTTVFTIGFFFLLYIGWLLWKKKSVNVSVNVNEGRQPFSATRQIKFAASVSLLNPHAIIDSVGVIGTNSLRFTGMELGAYTTGCIIVSFLWFLGLAIAGNCLHKLDRTGRIIAVVNKISALIIWAIALYLGWQLLNPTN